MHKAKNKHGPDTDMGIRRALARAAEVNPGKHPPWMEIRYGPPCKVASRGDPPGERWRTGTGKRDGPAVFACGPDKIWPPGILKSEKRRRSRPRDFVTIGQPDESPPGIVNKLTINNIDSSARSRLPTRRHLKQGILKDIYCLTAILGFSCKREKVFKPECVEKTTRGQGDLETRRIEARRNALKGSFLSSLIKQSGMENQVQRTAIFVEYDMKEQPKGAAHRNIKRWRTKTGIKNPRNDVETQRHATIDFLEWMVSTTLDHRANENHGLALTDYCKDRLHVRFSPDSYRDWKLETCLPLADRNSFSPCPLVSLSFTKSDNGYSELRPLVPELFVEGRPPSLVPLQTTINHKYLKTLNN